MPDTEIQWEGHNIILSNRVTARYLWLGTESVVNVDGVQLGITRGMRVDKLKCTFVHNDRPTELYLEVKSDGSIVDAPYKLYIDGSLISEGRLTVNNNWLLPLTLEKPNKKGKYKISNASCSYIIGILVTISSVIFLVSTFAIGIATPGGYVKASDAVKSLPGLCLLEIGVLSFFGIIAGIIGFFEKARNHLHARIGFIISAIIFFGWILLLVFSTAINK